MKKKLFHKFYSLSLALSLSAVSIAGATFAWIYTADYLTVDADGATIVEYFGSNTNERSDGTMDNPFVIYNPTHLYNLSMLQYYGAFEGNQYYFQLGKNSGVPFENDEGTEVSTLDMTGVLFYPIGTRTDPFISIFIGQSNVIENLTVTNPEDNPLLDVGFFGYVDANNTGVQTSVTDFMLKNITVESSNPVDDSVEATNIGLIAGNVNGGSLANIGVNIGHITPGKNNAANGGGYKTDYSLIGCTAESVSSNIGTQAGGILVLDNTTLKSGVIYRSSDDPKNDAQLGTIIGKPSTVYTDHITADSTSITYTGRNIVATADTVPLFKRAATDTEITQGTPTETTSLNNLSSPSEVSTAKANFNRIATNMSGMLAGSKNCIQTVRFNNNISSIIGSDPTSSTTNRSFFFFTYKDIPAEGETPQTGTLRMITYPLNTNSNYFSIFRRDARTSALVDVSTYIMGPRTDNTNHIYMLEYSVSSNYQYFIGQYNAGSGGAIAYMEFEGFSDTGAGSGEVKQVDFVYNDSGTMPYLPNHDGFTYSGVHLTFTEALLTANAGIVDFERTSSDAMTVTEPTSGLMRNLSTSSDCTVTFTTRSS